MARETEIQHDDTTKEELDVDAIVADASSPDRNIGLDPDVNQRLLRAAKLAAISRVDILRYSIEALETDGYMASEIWAIVTMIENCIRAARPDGDVPPF